MLKKNPSKSIFHRILSGLKKHQKALFFFLFFAIILFRIWLSTGIPKLYLNANYDDLYFARAALSMIKGDWMGAYDQFTLIKGPFYAFFLIISFLSGLPLYLNENLFFIFACIIFFLAVKPLIKNHWWRLLLFIFILFTPNSLALMMNLRVYREFVYYSLTLYIIAFTVGLVVRINRKPGHILFWGLGLGLSMGAFLLTREEGIWIYPVIGLIFLMTIIRIWRQKSNKPLLRSFLVLLPIPIWFLPILLISFLNFSHYGFWGVSEQLEPEFNRVLNTLARIETNDERHPAVQISASARMAAYEASPTFSQFKKPIEKNIEGWNYSDEAAMAEKPDWYLEKFGSGGSEISNGHFLWLFRDAVYAKGYYADGVYPKNLFKQIADELETACDTGELLCKEKSILPAMVGSIDKQHFPIIVRMFWENIIRSIKVDVFHIYTLDVDHNWPAWPDGNVDYDVFDQFSYNPVDTISTIESENLPNIINGVTDLRFRAMMIKENIMHFIHKIYKTFIPPITVVALINWFVLLYVSLFKSKIANTKLFAIISIFLLSGFLFRLLTLTIVDATTSIPGILYSQSTQLFQIAFSIIMFIWGIKFLHEKLAKMMTKPNQEGSTS